MEAPKDRSKLEVTVHRKVLPGSKAKVNSAGWARALELAGGDPSRIVIYGDELLVTNDD